MKYEHSITKHAIHIPSIYWLIQLLAYTVFVVAMLRYVPMEIAQRPWALAYTKFMASVVPMLGEIEKIPGFHPFLQFYYALLWAVIPLLASALIYVGITSSQSKSQRAARLEAPVRSLLVAIGVCTFFILLTLVWPVSPGSPSWRDKSLVQNAFGIGWFGLMTLWAWSGWLGCLCILIERIYFSLINKRK